MMIVINIFGILLLVFIVWWFWLSRPKSQRAIKPTIAGHTVFEIDVANGVYTPSMIEIDRGQPLCLRFIRHDPSPCAEVVRFDDLAIRVELPLGEAQDVLIQIEQPGDYAFHCEMDMYRGCLSVK